MVAHISFQVSTGEGLVTTGRHSIELPSFTIFLFTSLDQALRVLSTFEQKSYFFLTLPLSELISSDHNGLLIWQVHQDIRTHVSQSRPHDALFFPPALPKDGQGRVFM